MTTQPLRQLTDIFREMCSVQVPDGMEFGWKAVAPDLSSRNGVRWFPGQLVKPNPSGRSMLRGDACPSFDGDGLCLAKTAYGASMGGHLLSTVVAVGYGPNAVLGEDTDKLRVHSALVLDVLDITKANLDGANLRGAYLRGANLRGADLGGAYLRGANLDGANLRGAYLGGANLRGANLGGAYLRGAYLGGANLGGAYLRGAYLGGADLGSWECGPDGYARKKEQQP